MHGRIINPRCCLLLPSCCFALAGAVCNCLALSSCLLTLSLKTFWFWLKSFWLWLKSFWLWLRCSIPQPMPPWIASFTPPPPNQLRSPNLPLVERCNRSIWLTQFSVAPKGPRSKRVTCWGHSYWTTGKPKVVMSSGFAFSILVVGPGHVSRPVVV